MLPSKNGFTMVRKRLESIIMKLVCKYYYEFLIHNHIIYAYPFASVSVVWLVNLAHRNWIYAMYIL